MTERTPKSVTGHYYYSIKGLTCQVVYAIILMWRCTMAYYDGTKLLSQKDINGENPEIFICTANRTAGKTTYFNRLVVNKYKHGKGKFAVLYRFTYELDDCAEKFFKDIHELFFPDDTMISRKRAKGAFHELFLNGESCGYAIALNTADQIKKYSHLMSDVEGGIVFDEFQSETNHYCPDEVRKFQSIHTSLARGKGKQSKYLPVYMISNPVTIINPYYVAMGISARLTDKVKFLRGDGFVLEQGYNESAANAAKESGFNKAFSKDAYQAYANENVYLLDNLAFIDQPSGNSKYVATIRYNNCDYAIRYYTELGLVYCSDKADSSFRFKISVTTEDHNINYLMLQQNEPAITQFRELFKRGCVRFKDLRCKEAYIKLISF